MLSRIGALLFNPLGAATAATVAIWASALVSQSVLVDAATLKSPVGAGLDLPLGYLLFAPWFALLDHMSLLSVPQHLSIVCFALLSIALVGALKRDSKWALVMSLGFLVVLAVIVAVGTLVRRPMARISVSVPADNVVVDFHSHTNASHDGRKGFSLAANQMWHARSGFDVAYVTDHGEGQPFAAGRTGLAGGAGTIMLRGGEFVWRGRHVIGLGEPINTRALIQTLPGAITGDSALRPGPDTMIVATELVDGAPRGLAQGERERGDIFAVRDRWALAFVGSSNQHGWGFTSPVWSVAAVPNWRSLAYPELDRQLQQRLTGGGKDVRVLARRRTAEASTMLGLALTPVSFVVTIIRTLTPAERVSWTAWAGGIALLATLLGRRQTTMAGARKRVPLDFGDLKPAYEPAA